MLQGHKRGGLQLQLDEKNLCNRVIPYFSTIGTEIAAGLM